MRVIINDKRYGALKTLGERKQAFNEVLYSGCITFLDSAFDKLLSITFLLCLEFCILLGLSALN